MQPAYFVNASPTLLISIIMSSRCLSCTSFVVFGDVETARSFCTTYALPNWIPSLFAFQVSGLPTNQAFLKRLAAHPAFIAAELDTSFIQKHHASLVDCQPLPQHITALIAVADHLLQVQQASANWPCRACNQVSTCCKNAGAVRCLVSAPVSMPDRLSACLSTWMPGQSI